jgi:2,4-didehydro-3-deoxy-L-rhamnonate hydrolase
MKLIRFGEFGKEKPGILTADGLRKDCSAHFEDWNHAFFQNDGLAKLEKLIAESGESFPAIPESSRWGACVARPWKVICIGLNYSDHAVESGMQVPSEPIVFMKTSNTVVGPYDDVVIPRGSEKTDWEVELGVVIGKNARLLASPQDSANYIAGYCVCNDFSERASQLERGGQWVKGKSCDTFCPTGPFLATSDEITDVNNLAMTLDVNGQRMQNGSSQTMIFGVHFLVHYLSQFMTLEAGDIISTGTPPGVGLGQKPPKYLKPGDVIELSIEGLGSQRQVCRAEKVLVG